MNAKPQVVDSEKAKALQAALAQIEKQFGKGTIMRLGEGEVIDDIQVVSTGSLGLDIALGVGGLPRGRVIEIYGPESSGKTTLTLQVIAEMQKWLPLFEPYGVHSIKAGGSGADVGRLRGNAGALLGFVPDSQRYFDFHHANSDVLEAVNRRELELGSAAIAALIYLLDQ